MLPSRKTPLWMEQFIWPDSSLPDLAWSFGMQRGHSLGSKNVATCWDVPALLGPRIREHAWNFISALFHWKWEMELHITSWEISPRRDSRSSANAPFSWKETSYEVSSGARRGEAPTNCH